MPTRAGVGRVYSQVAMSMLPAWLLLLCSGSFGSFCWSLRVATFNMLAPVHKSAGPEVREGECEWLWMPRGRQAVQFIAKALKGCDVICLQEFWFEPAWVELFEQMLGSYVLLTARRSGLHPHDGSKRSDGVATLVCRKTHEVEESRRVEFEDGRVALVTSLIQRDRTRLVVSFVSLPCNDSPCQVANVHLPYPSNIAAKAKQERQVRAIADAVDALCWNSGAPTLGVVAGDFNCRAEDPAALWLEKSGWVDCAKACALKNLASGVGGVTEVGVTHKTHTGDLLRCDHLFARDYRPDMHPNLGGPNLELGYFDYARLALVRVTRIEVTKNVAWEPTFTFSDHLPVVAEFAPSQQASSITKCDAQGQMHSKQRDIGLVPSSDPGATLRRPDDDYLAWAPAPFPDTIC